MFRALSYFLVIFLLLFIDVKNLFAQTISTWAGTGSGAYSGDGGPATNAGITNPTYGQFDKYGNYYVADYVAKRIRKITTHNTISTIVGNGTGTYGGEGLPPLAVGIDRPHSAKLDTSGNIYISQHNDNVIRKFDFVSNMVTTIAGTGLGTFGGDGGPALGADIWNPQDVAIDKFGNIYIADSYNYRIRKIDASGNISTFAGTGLIGFSGDGGPATDAQIAFPGGIAVDDTGNVYIADPSSFSCRIRKVSLAGIITTIAGNGVGDFVSDGVPATDAAIAPFTVAIDRFGNVYSSDRYNHRVYKIEASTGLLYCVAGNGVASDFGDGGAATAASLYTPTGIAVDECGNLYIATIGDISVPGSGKRIRKVTYGIAPIASIGIVPNDTVCAGISVTFYTSPTGMGTATYQWYVNSLAVGSGTASYSYIPADGDSVYCKVTGIATCSGNTVTRFSNGVKITVLPATTVSFSFTPSPNDTVCEGTAVSIAASAIGGGSSPGYHWYKNGAPVLGGASYSFTPATADSVSCVFVSNATCPVPNDTVEQHVKFTVLPYVTPALGISSSLAPEESICEGDTVHFSSSVSGGGASPVLQWKVNGADVATGAAYAYSPSDGDTVHCVLTSSEMCTTSATAISNTIGPISVLPVVIPTVAISATASFASAGETVTVNAVVSGTSTYSIKWYLNSVYHATTALPQTTFVKGSGIDIITARVIPTGVLCLDSTDSAPLAVAIPNAISEVQTVQTLTVYPNPVSNTLHVNSTTKLHYVTITDAVGKQLKTEKVTARSAALDLRDLPPGIYLLTAYDDVGKVGSVTITRN